MESIYTGRVKEGHWLGIVVSSRSTMLGGRLRDALLDGCAGWSPSGTRSQRGDARATTSNAALASAAGTTSKYRSMATLAQRISLHDLLAVIIATLHASLGGAALATNKVVELSLNALQRTEHLVDEQVRDEHPRALGVRRQRRRRQLHAHALLGEHADERHHHRVRQPEQQQIGQADPRHAADLRRLDERARVSRMRTRARVHGVGARSMHARGACSSLPCT